MIHFSLFGALIGRARQDFSRSIPVDGVRDVFCGGRIGELLTEREELAGQIETLTDENQRITELLESTSRNYQKRGSEIAEYQRLRQYQLQEINRLKAEVAHYKQELEGMATVPERQRYRRLDVLAALATRTRIGAPHSRN
ncbi:hypothetical protein EON83_11240 [bacterium]|nr:MAG: hypothetical protein EON83_11240 [bacterium]